MSQKYASKDDFLNAKFGVEDFSIEGVGVVRIRPLSRTETINLMGEHKDSGRPYSETELHIFAAAVIEPQMTVEEWRIVSTSVPGGSLEALSNRIGEISGIGQNAKPVAKQVMQTFR